MVLNSKKKIFFFDLEQSEYTEQKSCFFGFCDFLKIWFFRFGISLNVEYKGILNVSDPTLIIELHTGSKSNFFVFFWNFSRILGIFDHQKYNDSMVLNSKFYKSIYNWNFWPNLWPLNCQKEINSLNKTLKFNIH